MQFFLFKNPHQKVKEYFMASLAEDKQDNSKLLTY